MISIFTDYMKLKKSSNDSGKILIIFQDENTLEIIKKIFDKFYKEPIFVILFAEDVKKVRKLINIQIRKLNSIKRDFVDIDNFFILENKSDNYRRIIIPILKVFSYYNQLGDGFFKDISDMNLKI